jgi:glycosyltransferase involved in cell wall biosynthesis
LLPTKGIATLVEALGLLGQGLDFECTIVGDGPERPRIESAVRDNGLSDKIRLTGRLSHAETLREIANADVFCLPSTVEAFGIVYLEAMAAGVPPIGCATTGAADLIVDGSSGWLVPPGDARALGAALREAMTDEPGRSRRARTARARAEQFTWDRNVDAMEKLMREVRRSGSIAG